MIFKIRYINSWMLKVLLGTNASQQFGYLFKGSPEYPFQCSHSDTRQNRGVQKVCYYPRPLTKTR